MQPGHPKHDGDPHRMNNNLKTLIAKRGLKITDTQLERLCACADLGESSTIWSKSADISQSSIVVVDEPPNPPQVHALRRALSPQATVIIPYGENPAFDYLKSRLRCQGVIGTQAPESPHLIWWGGKTARKEKSCLGDLLRSHIVTCVRPNTPHDAKAALFAKALNVFGVSYTIERNEAFISCDERASLRSGLLLTAWETSGKPLIWLDPHSSTDLMSLEFDIEGTDFAAISSSAGLATSFLYFGRTPAAFDLLKSWHHLCLEFPGLPANYLLDAAWAMITSQRTLVTKWLSPRDMNLAGERDPRANANLLEQSMLATPAQRQARKAGRTGTPEPHCILNSRFGGRGPLLLIMLAQRSARETATLVQEAAKAFAARDGGFSCLGILICQHSNDVADAIRSTTDGWILYAFPGLNLAADAFVRLSEYSLADRPVFIMPEPAGRRLTTTGVAIEAARAKAVFGRASAFNGRSGTVHIPAQPLQLVS
jgi:hypothetical protein